MKYFVQLCSLFNGICVDEHYCYTVAESNYVLSSVSLNIIACVGATL